MCTTPYGDVVRDEWLCSGINRPGVLFHTFVVMPDHFHGIIIIGDDGVDSGGGRGTADDRGTVDDWGMVDGWGTVDDRGTARRGTARRAPTVPATPCRAPTASVAPRDADHAPHTPAFGQPIAGSIPTIVGAFKSAVTKRINLARGTPGAPVWQRNYYECILPDLQALHRVETYIRNNPARG